MSRISDHSRESEKKLRFINIFHNPLTAWIILACSLLVTFTAYQISEEYVAQRALDRFNYRSEKILSEIGERMHIYEQALRGVLGAFQVSGSILDREQFKTYVSTLDINRYWPGIQGIGFSVPVSSDKKEEHIAGIRAEGFPEFTIRPEGERDNYSSIIYLEPFDWRNQRAFGYDMWSNEMRREAMMRARDEGVAATSGIITLVQETDQDVQRGFLTYLPLYKRDADLSTIDKRREAFVGWVYAPFRAGDLMEGIIGTDDPEIEFEIFDGTDIEKQACSMTVTAGFTWRKRIIIPYFQKDLILNCREGCGLFISIPLKNLHWYQNQTSLKLWHLEVLLLICFCFM